jgi:3',5'-cyclic AMP phosphodiesterase CpdA
VRFEQISLESDGRWGKKPWQPMPMNYTTCSNRRMMLARSIWAIVGFTLVSGLLRGVSAGVGAEPFRFIVVNDTHHENERSAAFLARTIETMRAGPAPDFCLHLGDLSHHGTEQELAAVKDMFARLGVPFWPVPGNHDYLTQTDRSGYDKVFPERLNYWFEHKGWLFVGLDTTDGVRAEKTTIQPATLHWVREQLPRWDKQTPMVLFTHFPLGPNRLRQRPLNAEELLALFQDHNLRIVFSGHHHAFTQVDRGRTKFLTHRCCAITQVNHDKTKQKGYLLCEARNGEVTFTFVEVPPLPASSQDSAATSKTNVPPTTNQLRPDRSPAPIK